ncbi:TPA: hypothetical protein ACPJ1X_004495 [Vibrio alginolyticus]|uniref:hypothetical protein n=1 Tax=Vibrio metschnikovii TaxID=28172 RepID=UPI001E0F60FF|nr:hypothetical protein [Vibrio vulnificus]EKO3588334.1 hypothetical protein [Vibrio metschnikovii]MDF4970793.1 hypothetical protein [Vibrio parahaemolyticus]HCG7937777.1 hypothetical protein [Vibrio parahaemolyticus]
MSNVLLFTPKHQIDFQKNYDDFISFAKNDLSLFEDIQFKTPEGIIQYGWECDKWSWKTEKGKKLTIVFGASQNHSKYTPFQPPFSDFAKAYVRYQQSLNKKDSTTWASSLVFLYQALEEHAAHNDKSSVDIMNINNNVIDRVEQKIRSCDLGAGGKRNIGLSFEKVLKFIKEKRFKLDLQDWSNPFPRQSDASIKLDEKSRKEMEDKCPSDYQMLQVADAFHKANTPRQKYFSSLCVMLMCQPSRNTELNGLTVNSLQRSDKGRWYLMWHPAKGGDPVRKWVPALLEDVVKQAFERLVEISAPARSAAKFAYDNPELFMLASDSESSQDKPLTYNQFAKAMGFKTGKSGRGVNITWTTYGSNVKWLNRLISDLNNVNNWKKDLCQGYTILPNNEVVNKRTGKSAGIVIRFPSYRDLRSIIDEQYKTLDFPNYGDMKVWDCITLVRDYEFHKEFAAKPFSWVHLGHGSLSDAIGSDRGLESIFDELGITDEDGTPLKLNSHQFRHWLNTKLKLAGEADWLIAKWSGRADIKQNKAYDGRTEKQKSRLTQRIGHVTIGSGVMTVAQANQLLEPYTAEAPPPPMVLHDLGLPISLKALGVDRDGVAQFTGLGFCVHNYAESPCVKNGDCEVCNEHVCLKGMPHSLDELKTLEALYEEQLRHAKAAAEDQVFGADRWVTALGFRLSKIKTLIFLLEDPKKADGAHVRIPDELSPSPVKRSLNINEQNAIQGFDLMALALSDMREA